MPLMFIYFNFSHFPLSFVSLLLPLACDRRFFSSSSSFTIPLRLPFSFRFPPPTTTDLTLPFDLRRRRPPCASPPSLFPVAGRVSPLGRKPTNLDRRHSPWTAAPPRPGPPRAPTPAIFVIPQTDAARPRCRSPLFVATPLLDVRGSSRTPSPLCDRRSRPHTTDPPSAREEVHCWEYILGV